MTPSVKKAKMDSPCPHREDGTGTPDPRTYSTNIQQARNRIRIRFNFNGWTLEDERAGAPLWGFLPPPSENLKRSKEQENV